VMIGFDFVWLLIIVVVHEEQERPRRIFLSLSNGDSL